MSFSQKYILNLVLAHFLLFHSFKISFSYFTNPLISIDYLAIRPLILIDFLETWEVSVFLRDSLLTYPTRHPIIP